MCSNPTKSDTAPAAENEAELAEYDSGVFDDLVVFDLETTGLSPTGSEIIQIAASRIRRGEFVDGAAFFSYVKPKRRISAFITEYTGITNQDVARAPKIMDVLKDFSAYCGDSVLVAHNGHRFDIPFIRAACESRRHRTREVKYIDSMHLSWNVWGRERGTSHSLDNVVRRLCIPQDDVRRHDARGDVSLTARCVVELFDRIKRGPEKPRFKIYRGVLPAGRPKSRRRDGPVF